MAAPIIDSPPVASARTMNDNDEQLRAFGEFVRAQRRLAQVSQRNLARMSGVSDSYLSQLERGNYRPSPQVVKALAAAFGLEPKQLYTMLGFMDDEDGASTPSVEQAIQLDPRLDAGQKDALIRTYRSFIGNSS
jgi:transcriptional regulator with XRE-family HTH domain